MKYILAIFISVSLLSSQTFSKNVEDNYKEYEDLKTLFLFTSGVEVYDIKHVCLGYRQLINMQDYLKKNPYFSSLLNKKEKEFLNKNLREYSAMVTAYRVGDSQSSYCK